MENKKWDINFNNVGVTYSNGKEALKHVDVEIKQGELISVIGLSGAGKTTFLKTINLINNITSGEIIVGDKNDVENSYRLKELKGNEKRQYRTNIGMVFQNYNLIYNSSVIKNVLTALLPKLPWYRSVFSIYTKEEKEIAYNALAAVNILELAYVKAKDLSGGQMQRVALARTIAQGAKIILADEPVGALDPVMAKTVMDQFYDVNKKQNITVILNLHHVELALQYTDRIIGVRNGVVVYDGPSEKVDLNVLKQIYGDQLEGFGTHELAEVKRRREILLNGSTTKNK